MKKKKSKKLKILKGLGILIIIGLFVFLLLNIRVKNIYVTGNNILTDQDIIELAGIQNYPKLFSVSIHKMKNQIKMNQVIDEVNIKKSLFGRIDINVLDNYQNQGNASKLLEFMFDDLKNNKVENVTLEVRKNNLNAIHLYKKYGFEEIGIRKGYYQGIDGILMKKELM